MLSGGLASATLWLVIALAVKVTLWAVNKYITKWRHDRGSHSAKKEYRVLQLGAKHPAGGAVAGSTKLSKVLVTGGCGFLGRCALCFCLCLCLSCCCSSLSPFPLAPNVARCTTTLISLPMHACRHIVELLTERFSDKVEVVVFDAAAVLTPAQPKVSYVKGDLRVRGGSWPVMLVRLCCAVPRRCAVSCRACSPIYSWLLHRIAHM